MLAVEGGGMEIIMKKVLIFGDVMLDEYIFGPVSRVSPEAPVPVVRAISQDVKIGGAGNVANNVSALGGIAAGIFLIGYDANSDFIVDILDKTNIIHKWVVRNENISAIRKTRVVGNRQQIVRIDYNDACAITESAYKKIVKNIQEAVSWSDIIVISDYSKGLCTEELCRCIIDEAKRQKKITIVDPKGNNWEKYRGATIITPNMKEINQYSGLDILNDDLEIKNAYYDLPEKLGIDYLLLTRSEKGMTLIGRKSVVSINAIQRKVFDVSGAGDTVIATLAVELKNDLSNIIEAMKVANIAAGIVVGKPGTAVVTESELSGELGESIIRNKIFKVEDRNSLKKLVDSWKGKGETVVTTNGCFDILHKGHISLLEEANKLADHLIVLLNSDDSVKKLKGCGRPINSETDRAFLLAALSSVDAVAIFDPLSDEALLTDEEWESIPSNMLKIAKESPIGILKLLYPDIHVKGGDYEEKDVPETKFAKRFQALCFIEGYSTTNLVRKVGEI